MCTPYLPRVIIMSTEMTECSICLDPIRTDPPLTTIVLSCGHIFHWKCIQGHIQIKGEAATCPICRSALPIRTTTSVPNPHSALETEGTIEGRIEPRVFFVLRNTRVEEVDEVDDEYPIHREHREHRETQKASPCVTLTTYTASSLPIISSAPTTTQYYYATTHTSDHIFIQYPAPTTPHVPIYSENPDVSERDNNMMIRQQLLWDVLTARADPQHGLEAELPTRPQCRHECILCILIRGCECILFGALVSIIYAVGYANYHQH